MEEHLKCAGSSIIESVTNLFNQIFLNKKVPEVFKTGILTPVLKKSKDPTNLDNYRDITVTPILGSYYYHGYLKISSSHYYSSVSQKGCRRSCLR